jgi:hypothetical protein
VVVAVVIELLEVVMVVMVEVAVVVMVVVLTIHHLLVIPIQAVAAVVMGFGTSDGKAGGSGIVVIKIPDTRSASFSAGVTQTSSTAGGFTVFTVTATSTTSETVIFL